MSAETNKTKERFVKTWGLIENDIRECRKHVEPMLTDAGKKDEYKLTKEDVEMLERFRTGTIRLLKLSQEMLKELK